jgi:hypothetical protein
MTPQDVTPLCRFLALWQKHPILPANDPTNINVLDDLITDELFPKEFKVPYCIGKWITKLVGPVRWSTWNADGKCGCDPSPCCCASRSAETGQISCQSCMSLAVESMNTRQALMATSQLQS